MRISGKSTKREKRRWRWYHWASRSSSQLLEWLAWHIYSDIWSYLLGIQISRSNGPLPFSWTTLHAHRLLCSARSCNIFGQVNNRKYNRCSCALQHQRSKEIPAGGNNNYARRSSGLQNILAGLWCELFRKLAVCNSAAIAVWPSAWTQFCAASRQYCRTRNKKQMTLGRLVPIAQSRQINEKRAMQRKNQAGEWWLAQAQCWCLVEYTKTGKIAWVCESWVRITCRICSICSPRACARDQGGAHREPETA